MIGATIYVLLDYLSNKDVRLVNVPIAIGSPPILLYCSCDVCQQKRKECQVEGTRIVSAHEYY